jgi:hypothetical protein
MASPREVLLKAMAASILNFQLLKIACLIGVALMQNYIRRGRQQRERDKRSPKIFILNIDA